MAYIKKLKDNELIGGTDNTDVYPISTTQALYSQDNAGNVRMSKNNPNQPEKLEERLVDHEDNIEELHRDFERVPDIVNEVLADTRIVNIEGDVTNAADEEDLTSVNVSGVDVIKFKDKAYAPTAYSGLGRKYLRKNIVNGVNVLTQDMIPVAETAGEEDPGRNTIYVIQYDYDLNGQTIKVPSGCVLEFDGGSLRNGNIICNHTFMEGKPIFNNIIIDGLLINEKLFISWFGISANDIETNNDKKWKDIIESSKNTGSSVFVEEGTYGIFDQIDIVSYTSIIGSSVKPRLYFYGDNSLFCCQGNNIVIKNINCEAVTYGVGTGIKIGDTNYCINSVFENISSSKFRIGVDCHYCWNNKIDKITVTFNSIGLLHKVTQANITNFVCEGNSVGVQVDKLGDYDTPNLRICQGTIEGNGMGVMINAGDVSLKEIYFEGNTPSDNNNGTSYPVVEDYPNGCEILCGYGDYYVTSLIIQDCYVGHSDYRYSSLFKIGKCNNFSVIGTYIKNLECTDNTTIGIFNNNIINKLPHQEGATTVKDISIVPSLSFTTSSAPSFHINSFDENNIIEITGANRYTLNAGFFLSVPYRDSSKTKLAVSDGTLKIYSEERLADLYCSFLIDIGTTDVLDDNDYSYIIKFKYSDMVSRIVIDKGTENALTIPVGTFTNKELSYYLQIPKGKFVTIYPNDNYEANNINNGITIEGIYIYKGKIANFGIINNYGKIWETPLVSQPQKALILPSVTPSERTYDFGYVKGPFAYYNIINHKINSKYDGISYDYDGVRVAVLRIGDYDSRPAAQYIYPGFKFYATNFEKQLTFNGTRWVDGNGFTPGLSKGMSNQRPSNLNATSDKGYSYFDTSLSPARPIYWNGTAWVDATGAIV